MRKMPALAVRVSEQLRNLNAKCEVRATYMSNSFELVVSLNDES